MNVLDFVLKIDNVVPDYICDEYIKLFEESDKKERLERNGYPNWTNLFLDNHPQAEKKILERSNVVAREYQDYLGEYGLYFNTNDFHFEGANIKKYVGGSNDVYKRHADVGCLDTCRRFVAMIYYLNDDYEGGDTVFYPECYVRPKKGSVVVFPPFWLFPHEGTPVTKGEKYIMSTYCLWNTYNG